MQSDPAQLRRRVPDSGRQRTCSSNRRRSQKSQGASRSTEDCRCGPELSQRGSGDDSFIAPRAIPRTSSGKIMRHKTKQMWLQGQFTVLSDFSREKDAGKSHSDMHSSFAELKARYNLTGLESYNLVEAGLDSLDLVVFTHELKELLKDKGAELLARQVDIGVIQRVSVAELFGLAEKLERAPQEALVHLRHSLAAFREEQCAAEKQMMSNDKKLIFEPPAPSPMPEISMPNHVLLTGGYRLHRAIFLSRACSTDTGEDLCSCQVFRRKAGQAETESCDGVHGTLRSGLMEMFEARVIPVSGDLGQPKLGLMQEVWDFLAREIDTVFHNGATVNYLYNYDLMRDANVLGTNEVVRLAFEGSPKEFNYVSTTFVFGWRSNQSCMRPT